jgi:hypothetical protein
MVALVLAEAIPAPVQIDWLPAFFMAGSRILYDDDALGSCSLQTIARSTGERLLHGAGCPILAAFLFSAAA